MMGNEIFLHNIIGRWQFLARVDSRTKARPGEEIELVLDMSKMHAFDPATQARII